MSAGGVRRIINSPFSQTSRRSSPRSAECDRARLRHVPEPVPARAEVTSRQLRVIVQEAEGQVGADVFEDGCAGQADVRIYAAVQTRAPVRTGADDEQEYGQRAGCRDMADEPPPVRSQARGPFDCHDDDGSQRPRGRDTRERSVGGLGTLQHGDDDVAQLADVGPDFRPQLADFGPDFRPQLADFGPDFRPPTRRFQPGLPPATRRVQPARRRYGG